jgi:hypothetical protein
MTTPTNFELFSGRGAAGVFFVSIRDPEEPKEEATRIEVAILIVFNAASSGLETVCYIVLSTSAVTCPLCL